MRGDIAAIGASPKADVDSVVPSPKPYESRRSGTLKAITATAAMFGLFAGLAALLYATSVHFQAGTSDKATVILEGQAIGNGHVLLHGWVLTFAQYWTIDAPFYALAVHFGGLRPWLLYAGPAFMAALTIVVGVAIAREGRHGAAGFAGGAVAVALLLFATPSFAFYFVARGFHVGTGLYALIAFAALRRGRFGWRWALAVAALALGLLGDLQIVAFGILPLILSGVVAMRRQRNRQAGLAQVTAGAASLVIAELIRGITLAFGAFSTAPSMPLAHLGQMLANLAHVATYGASLIGLTDGLFGRDGIPVWLWVVHVIGAIGLLAGVVVALVNLVAGIAHRHPRQHAAPDEPELWRLDDMLLIGAFCSTLPFVALAYADRVGVRYLTVSVLFTTILAGRMIARYWPSPRPAVLPKRLGAIAGTALCLAFAAGFGFWLARPGLTNSTPALTAWLESHHLSKGLGDYWTASITTVQSSGEVTVRPVLANRDDEIQRMDLSSDTWYRGQRFQFLVYSTPSYERVNTTSATLTWGPPAHVYDVGHYRVLVWPHPITISPLVYTRAYHDELRGPS